MEEPISRTVLGFDPGETTGFFKANLTILHSGSATVLGFEHGEIHKDMPDFINTVLDLVKGVDTVVVERAVTTGALNANKVNQLKVTERIVVIVDMYNILHPKETDVFVQWIHPESKRLCREVPSEIKGDHARDAYKITAAYLKLVGKTLI